MSSQEQPRFTVKQCSLRLLKCLLGLLKCLLGVIFIFVALPFGFVYLICALCFGPPIEYYRQTILNSDAMMEKYVVEGIQLEGQVASRWTSGDDGRTHNVRVEYQVNEVNYTKDFVVSEDLFSQPTLELIRLPDYPKSAILSNSMPEMDDKDFPPSKLQRVFFVACWMAMWNLLPLIFVLSSIKTCPYCSWLIGPVFVGVILLELVMGYWLASRHRDSNLRSSLYGAKEIDGNNDATENNPQMPFASFLVTITEDDAPRKVSYKEFFDEKSYSCCFNIRSILHDLFTILACEFIIIYFVLFGGGYCIIYSLVISKWRNKLLQTYESNALCELGTIKARRRNKIIVTYEVDGCSYKKCLAIPYHVVRNEHQTVPDNPNILYLVGLPKSGVLSDRITIENLNQERKSSRDMICMSLVLLAVQVFYGTLLFCDLSSVGRDYWPIVMGIYIACHAVFGLAGGCIHYRFFFRKELLYRAKQVVHPSDTRRRTIANEDLDVWHEPGMETHNLNVELESDEQVDSGSDIELQTHTDEEEDASMDNTEATKESADDFINNFMSGKFPRFDKAFK